MPLRPKTPLLVGISWPLAPRPAPAAPAVFAAPPTVEFTAPVPSAAVRGTLLAAPLAAVPTLLVAEPATPPTPPARPAPEAPPIALVFAPPIGCRSSPPTPAA